MSKKNNHNQCKDRWTSDLLKEYFDALREADQRAIQIKETADAEALDLARQIQTYKDEKANELREQINSERGLYLTRTEYLAQHQSLVDRVDSQTQALIDKMDSSLKPLNEFMLGQLGQNSGKLSARTLFFSVLSAITGFGGLILILFTTGAIK
jgi:vacuolar-type H+-ATPase subunit E/Vma4